MRDVGSWHFCEVTADNADIRLLGDSVAKVVLPKVPKILGAAGAVFV
jgi:hypothetical protein